MAGHEQKISRPLGTHVGASWTVRRRQLDPQFLQAVVESHESVPPRPALFLGTKRAGGLANVLTLGSGALVRYDNDTMVQEALRRLPSIHRFLADARLQPLLTRYPHAVIVAAAREYLSSVRQSVQQGGELPAYDDLVSSFLGQIPRLFAPSLRPVINGTGVILHTNLGRAPLSAETMQAMTAVSTGYSNLEFNLETGERGSRHVHLERVLTRLTGAESAMAVNNNASALLLTLATLAQDREVVISRGQLVEIGGGFRIPDVMAQSGARLVEVGTTNRTYLRDYEQAVTANTVAFLRVHSSNFRIVGFTESTPLTDLVALARRCGILVIDDIGSGCLLDVTRYGLAKEPTVQESLAAGADLVLFSGDKLLGGPQAGIIVGREELIARLRRHPLARAVRMDKASIAGLIATIAHYLRGEAEEKIPVWRMISMPIETIEARASACAKAIGEAARVIPGRSMIGGGSLPEESLPTALVALTPAMGATAAAAALRRNDPPIVARIERDQVVIDLRTVDPADDQRVILALKDLVGT
jgi:L-seryl-tRNA(Ser) seleniumtransferase